MTIERPSHPTWQLDDADHDLARCVHSLHLMAVGSPAEFELAYTADAINREAAAEPPATRGPS